MTDDFHVQPIAWGEDDTDNIIVSSNGSYPRLLQLKNGKMLCAYDGMYVRISDDFGFNWSEPIKASPIKLDCFATANAALIELANGDILLGYRAIGDTEKGFYTSLYVSVSHDNGSSWSFHSQIDEHYGEGGVWEPHFGYVGEQLTVFFADDSADRMGNSGFQHIISMQYIDGEWQNRKIISDGNEHRSRDGMPTWIRLAEGGYVVVIEAWDNENNDQMMIKILSSDDGINFSEPNCVYRSRGTGSKAAAPFVVELPDGSLAISFQTDEDSELKGDRYSVIKTVRAVKINDKYLFSVPTSPLETPQKYHSIWNSLYLAKNKDGEAVLLAVSGTNFGGIRLVRKKHKGSI